MNQGDGSGRDDNLNQPESENEEKGLDLKLPESEGAESGKKASWFSKLLSIPVLIITMVLIVLGVLVFIGGPWSSGPPGTAPGGAILRPGSDLQTKPEAGLQYQCVMNGQGGGQVLQDVPDCTSQATLLLFAYNLSSIDYWLSVYLRTPAGQVITLIPGSINGEVEFLERNSKVSQMGIAYPLSQLPQKGNYGMIGVFTKERPDVADLAGRIEDGSPLGEGVVSTIRLLRLGED